MLIRFRIAIRTVAENNPTTQPAVTRTVSKKDLADRLDSVLITARGSLNASARNMAAVAANALTHTQITTLVADEESSVGLDGYVGKSFNARRLARTVAMTTASAVLAKAGMFRSQRRGKC